MASDFLTKDLRPLTDEGSPSASPCSSAQEQIVFACLAKESEATARAVKA